MSSTPSSPLSPRSEFVRANSRMSLQRPGIFISGSRSLTQPNLLDNLRPLSSSAPLPGMQQPPTEKATTITPPPTNNNGADINTAPENNAGTTATTTTDNTAALLQIKSANAVATALKKKGSFMKPALTSTVSMSALDATSIASPTSNSPTTPLSPSPTSSPRTAPPTNQPALEKMHSSPLPRTDNQLNRSDSTGMPPKAYTLSTVIPRFAPDEEQEKIKGEKEFFRTEVMGIIRELKIQQLTIGVPVRLFTKGKLGGVHGQCRLSKDKKYIHFFEKVGANVELDPDAIPSEHIVITAMASADPSVAPTLDPQLLSTVNKKDLDQSLMFSLTFKDQSIPAIVLLFAIRSDFACWLDGFACLMNTPNNSAVMKDVELLCEVFALDKIYPSPPEPPLPEPELLAALE